MTVEVEADGDATIRVAVGCGEFRHRLQGMDRYWWTDDGEFGMFNVDTWQYEGKQSVSFRCVDGGFVDTGGVAPPDGATVIVGHGVSDERARQLGLL